MLRLNLPVCPFGTSALPIQIQPMLRLNLAAWLPYLLKAENSNTTNVKVKYQGKRHFDILGLLFKYNQC